MSAIHEFNYILYIRAVLNYYFGQKLKMAFGSSMRTHDLHRSFDEYFYLFT